jgi:hypothetical protein
MFLSKQKELSQRRVQRIAKIKEDIIYSINKQRKDLYLQDVQYAKRFQDTVPPPPQPIKNVIFAPRVAAAECVPEHYRESHEVRMQHSSATRDRDSKKIMNVISQMNISSEVSACYRDKRFKQVATRHQEALDDIQAHHERSWKSKRERLLKLEKRRSQSVDAKTLSMSAVMQTVLEHNERRQQLLAKSQHLEHTQQLEKEQKFIVTILSQAD